jgi:hypothetical protein
MSGRIPVCIEKDKRQYAQILKRLSGFSDAVWDASVSTYNDDSSWPALKEPDAPFYTFYSRLPTECVDPDKIKRRKDVFNTWKPHYGFFLDEWRQNRSIATSEWPFGTVFMTKHAYDAEQAKLGESNGESSSSSSSLGQSTVPGPDGDAGIDRTPKRDLTRKIFAPSSQGSMQDDGEGVEVIFEKRSNPTLDALFGPNPTKMDKMAITGTPVHSVSGSDSSSDADDKGDGEDETQMPQEDEHDGEDEKEEQDEVDETSSRDEGEGGNYSRPLHSAVSPSQIEAPHEELKDDIEMDEVTKPKKSKKKETKDDRDERKKRESSGSSIGTRVRKKRKANSGAAVEEDPGNAETTLPVAVSTDTAVADSTTGKAVEVSITDPAVAVSESSASEGVPDTAVADPNTGEGGPDIDPQPPPNPPGDSEDKAA